MRRAIPPRQFESGLSHYMMTKKIAVLPGDGIGTEIVAEALKVLDVLKSDYGLKVETEEALIGGAAYDATGTPFPKRH